MRWLLVKDLQILRRSPLLVVLLVAYPILVALLIGFDNRLVVMIEWMWAWFTFDRGARLITHERPHG